MRGSTARLVSGVFVVLLTCASTGRAEDAADAWRFSISPYLWAPSLSGDVTVRGRSSSVDASFIDVVDESDSLIGGFADVEWRNDTWSVFVSPSYMDLAVKENATVGPLSLASEVGTTVFMLEFGGGYRVSAWGEGGGRGTASGGSLEILAGGRYTDLELEIDLDVAGLPPGFPGAREVSNSKEWVEPFVGARSQVRLSRNWVMSLRGDVGGFGVGSDLALQGVGLVGYELGMFGQDAIVFGGYRALYQDYDDGSGATRFEWDMVMHGPVLGLNLRF